MSRVGEAAPRYESWLASGHPRRVRTELSAAQSVVKLLATAHEPRLGGRDRDAGDRGDLAQIVPEHVEEQHRGGLLATQRGQLFADPRELAARAGLSFGVDVRTGAAGF